MANLTKDLNYDDTASLARKHPWPYRLTNALQVFKGSALGLNPSTGLAVKWADTAGYLWLGICSQQALGDTSATPPVEAEVHEGNTLKRLTVTGVSAITDMKTKVFLSTDNPDDVTLTATSNVKAVGEIVRWYSSTTADVRFYTPEEYRNQVLTADITALTDNSGGTASDTIAAIGATYDQAEVRNAVASLAAKINAILAELNVNQ